MINKISLFGRYGHTPVGASLKRRFHGEEGIRQVPGSEASIVLIFGLSRISRRSFLMAKLTAPARRSIRFSHKVWPIIGAIRVTPKL